MPMFPITVDIRVNGLPAKARVLRYQVYKGTLSPTAPDPDTHDGWIDLEYEIKDAKGYPAPWIENIMDEMDLREDVEHDIMEMVDSAREALKEDQMEARRKGEV